MRNTKTKFLNLQKPKGFSQRELIIMGSILALVLVAGCVPIGTAKTKVYVCEDGTEVLDHAQCDAIEDFKNRAGELEEYQKISGETESAEPAEVEEPKIDDQSLEGISDDAAVLINKFKTKVKDLEFGFAMAPATLPKYTYLISEDTMKVTLRPKEVFENEMIDTIYIDLEKGTAVAYCEDYDRNICPDRDKEFDMEDYSNYDIESPFVWIDSIEAAYLSGVEKRLEKRNAEEMVFVRDGVEGSMYVDSFYGAPLTIKWSGESYAFKDLAVNSADAEDFEHQSIAS